MKKYTYNALIYREWDTFVAQCVEYDIASFGDTHEHALEMLKEAISLAHDDITPIEIQSPTITQFDLSYA